MNRQLLQAAEKGDADSQFNLGVLYANDFDDDRHAVEGNRVEAVRWLLAAAEQGLPRAQIKLAELYAAASDMTESHVKAGGWYLLATTSLRGAYLNKAQSGYDRVCLHLTPRQIEQVRRFARNWKPSRPNEGPVEMRENS
jgi:TPR repeat protein